MIPTLAEVARRWTAPSVLDVGCGTGYVSRHLAYALGNPSPSLTLIERDPHMLAYAAEALAAVRQVRFLRSDLESYSAQPDRPAFDLCFCCYTLLEVEDLIGFSRALKKLVPRGHILLFVPDAVEDVVSHFLAKGTTYPKGATSFRLEKVNAFTGQGQTFIARQALEYIAAMIDAETVLHEIRMFRTAGGGRHIALGFDRLVLGDG